MFEYKIDNTKQKLFLFRNGKMGRTIINLPTDEQYTKMPISKPAVPSHTKNRLVVWSYSYVRTINYGTFKGLLENIMIHNNQENVCP